jgi:hypothetical protein
MRIKNYLRTIRGLNKMDINGFCLFDEEKKKFKTRQEFKQIVNDFWEQCLRKDEENEFKDIEFNFKFNYFKEQFEGWYDKESGKISIFDVWDYTAVGETWVLVEIPEYMGLGIYLQDNYEEMFKEIKKLCVIHNETIIKELKQEGLR